MKIFVWNSDRTTDRVEFEPQADDLAFVVMRVKARNENGEQHDLAIALDQAETMELTQQLVEARVHAQQSIKEPA